MIDASNPKREGNLLVSRKRDLSRQNVRYLLLCFDLFLRSRTYIKRSQKLKFVADFPETNFSSKEKKYQELKII